jgi:hypothetical protein
MKFNAYPTKISGALERSRADVQKKDLTTRGIISRAGIYAN